MMVTKEALQIVGKTLFEILHNSGVDMIASELSFMAMPFMK